MLGWHFLMGDKRLRFGDGRIVRTGRTYKTKNSGEIWLCENGMHASRRLIDALRWHPLNSGTCQRKNYCCRVDVRGELTMGHLAGEDKFAGRRRRVLWMVEAHKVLREFYRRIVLGDLRRASDEKRNRCLTAMMVAEHRKRARR